jgi:hypothetical protein
MKMKMKSRNIVLILVLVVGIVACVFIKTDAVHLIIPRESIDVNDVSAVWRAIDKKLDKYYGTKKYDKDTPEVRREKVLAILEKLEDEGLIEEGSISSDSMYIYYTTATGDRFFLEYHDRDPNHNEVEFTPLLSCEE